MGIWYQRWPWLVCMLTLPVLIIAMPVQAADLLFRATYDSTVDADTAAGNGRATAGGSIQFFPGKSGRAIGLLPGAYLRYESADNLNPDEGSIALWISPVVWTGDDATDRFFVRILTDTGVMQLHKAGATRELRWSLLRHGSTTMPDAPRQIIDWQPGEWHHVVVTWNRSRARLFVDGQLVGETHGAPLRSSFGRLFAVGEQRGNVPAGQPETLFDDLMIFGRELTAQEVAHLIQHGTLPTGKSPGVEISWSVNPYFDLRIVNVQVNVIGASGDTPLEAVASLIPENDTTPVVRAEHTLSPTGTGRMRLPLGEISPGWYNLQLELRAGNSRLFEDSRSILIEEPPIWVSERPGLDVVVVPPWTPIEATPNEASVWGRSISFSGELVSQIVSRDEPLLSGPIRLETVLGETVIPLTYRVAGFDYDEARTVYQMETPVDLPVQARVTVTLDFDGLLKYDLRVTSDKPVNGMKLVIPLRESHATFLHYIDENLYRGSQAMRVPSHPDHGEVWSGPFRPFVWLGDDWRGLAWFSETDEPFHIKDRETAIQLVRHGDTLMLEINLIDEPTDLSTTPFVWTFGLQATPTRPKPEDHTLWRMTPAPGARIDLVWWQQFSESMPYPKAKDPELLAARIRSNQTVGAKTLPYMALAAVSELAPEFQKYGESWLRQPRWQLADEGIPHSIVSPGSGWGDFLPWAVQKLIDETGVDGLYFDYGFVYADTNELAGSGYTDRDGVLRPTWAIFATREMARRIYTIMKEHDPESIIMTHMSNNMMIPVLSFSDAVVNGEHLRQPLQAVDGDYSKVITLDEMRAIYMTSNWGPVSFIIPEFATPAGPPRQEWIMGPERSELLLAYTLLHDIKVWPIYINLDVLRHVWSVQDGFGLKGSEFIPYFANDIITGQTDTLKVSTWKRDNRLLLVISNLGPTSQRATLEIRRDLAGLSGNYLAVDMHRFELLPLRDNRFLEMTIPPKTFRLVIVRPE